MRLQHQLSVPADRETTWELLTDVARIAACLPGAHVDETRDDGFAGRFTIKLGPISVEYAGSARFVERSEEDGRLVLAMQGRDRRGNGGAQATLVARMRDDDASHTTVELETELDVTGRAAQLGGSLLSEVGNRLIGQFAANLARDPSLAGGRPQPAVDAPKPHVLRALAARPGLSAALAAALLALMVLLIRIPHSRTGGI